jgi:hypothetical protein
VKPKPLLVYLTRHAPTPALADVLTGYEIIRVRKRFRLQSEVVEEIARVCPRPPIAIMWVMPWGWVSEFIVCVGKRWNNPRPEIVHAEMAGEQFLGSFTIQKLGKRGQLVSYPWYPVGPVDTERQMAIAALVEAAKDRAKEAL